jgi:class 3 adenylate cyclase
MLKRAGKQLPVSRLSRLIVGHKRQENRRHNLVPHFILKQYAAAERNGRFPATALFVDISGFSTITDALMQHGQHGAEVLATLMNSVFDPLVRCVYEQGGFIISFAGDAFTAVFPASPLQALAAGWMSQQQCIATATMTSPTAVSAFQPR